MLRGQTNIYLSPEHPIIAIWNNRNQNGPRICKKVYYKSSFLVLNLERLILSLITSCLGCLWRGAMMCLVSLGLLVTLGRCSPFVWCNFACWLSLLNGTIQHFLEVAVVLCLQHGISVVSLFNLAPGKFKSELPLPFTTLDLCLKNYNNNRNTESCITICCMIYQ